MASSLGTSVIIENKPGAGGRIGEEFVAKSSPDGQVILVAPSGITITPALIQNLPYRTATDFLPVTQLVATMNLLVASPQSNISTISDLLVQARAKPGTINYGHPGVGTSLQLGMELFRSKANIEIQGVPYKGDGPIATALMSGEIDLAAVAFSNSILQAISTGRLKAIGVSSRRRSTALPEVPTYTEAGVEVEHISWYGLFVPAKTPKSIINAIAYEAIKALRIPEVKSAILAMGQEPVGNSPEEFEIRFRSDIEKFSFLIKNSGIPLQK